MVKKIVKLTESDLHKIVENSVRRIISEKTYDFDNIIKNIRNMSDEDLLSIINRESTLSSPGSYLDFYSYGEQMNDGKYEANEVINAATQEYESRHNRVKESLVKSHLHKIVENSVRRIISEKSNMRIKEAFGIAYDIASKLNIEDKIRFDELISIQGKQGDYIGNARGLIIYVNTYSIYDDMGENITEDSLKEFLRKIKNYGFEVVSKYNSGNWKEGGKEYDVYNVAYMPSIKYSNNIDF